MITRSSPGLSWPDEDPCEEIPARPGDAPVRSVLRACPTVASDEPITVAWRRAHGPALVVDRHARPVGVLGYREAAAVWPSRPPSGDEPTAGDAVRGVRVRRLNGATTIRAAIRIVLSEGIEVLPVVADDGRALGLVTALDLLAALEPVVGAG